MGNLTLRIGFQIRVLVRHPAWNSHESSENIMSYINSHNRFLTNILWGLQMKAKVILFQPTTAWGVFVFLHISRQNHVLWVLVGYFPSLHSVWCFEKENRVTSPLVVLVIPLYFQACLQYNKTFYQGFPRKNKSNHTFHFESWPNLWQFYISTTFSLLIYMVSEI